MGAGQKPYKTAKDFGSAEDYARYVRDNVRVGMLVKCKDDYEEVKSGDIGRVTKVGVAYGCGVLNHDYFTVRLIHNAVAKKYEM